MGPNYPYTTITGFELEADCRGLVALSCMRCYFHYCCCYVELSSGVLQDLSVLLGIKGSRAGENCTSPLLYCGEKRPKW